MTLQQQQARTNNTHMQRSSSLNIKKIKSNYRIEKSLENYPVISMAFLLQSLTEDTLNHLDNAQNKYEFNYSVELYNLHEITNSTNVA